MRARRLWSPWITVLTYHRAVAAVQESLFDQGVIDVTPQELDEQLQFLAENYQFIGIADLLRFRAGASLPGNPVLITFDDGYRDNYDTVFPLLKRYGARATFFIATDYVQSRRLFWWDKLNYLVKCSLEQALEISYPVRETLPLVDTPQSKARAIQRLLAVVKRWRGLDVDRFLDGVGHAAAVNLTPEQERGFADRLLMTWDQIRELRRCGMDVQSHTSTHRVLQTLSESELFQELVGSKRLLEDVLSEPVVAVSYPVGKELERSIQDAVAASGYELGFSNATGFNLRWALSPYNVRRVAMDRGQPAEYFRAMLSVPVLAY